MRKVLNIISALFLTFSILVAGNVFVNVSEEKNTALNSNLPEDPKVKAAAITYEMAPAPESAYSENLQTTVVNNSIYSNNDMVKGFLAWRDTPLGQVRKVDILPDTYFSEDAQFEKHLNVSEDGLIKGLLNIGGGLIVDGDARFKDKVTIDEGEVKVNGVEYVFPEEQAAGDGYVLSNNGEGELDWIAQDEIFPGISGTDNRLARFNAAGNDIENGSINDLYAGGVALTVDATGNLSLISNIEVSGTANMTNLSIANVSVTSSAGEINFLDGASVVAGGLAFGNGAGFTQDSANIFWNDSLNRLGVGTSAPESKLTVAGNISIGSGYTGVGISAPLNGLLVEGRVGIGTTNPSGLLDIGSFSAFNSLGQLGINSVSPQAGLDVVSTAWFRGAAGQQGLYVNSSGNVGIGTTSPSFALELSGTSAINRKIGIGGLQVFYLPDQSVQPGNLIIGDGGSIATAGWNTLVGIDAGNGLTGWGNSIIGFNSANQIDDTNQAVIIGYHNLNNKVTNFVDSVLIGSNIGSGSGAFTTSGGGESVIIGSYGAYNLDDALGNVFVGESSGSGKIGASNVDYNVGIGYNALDDLDDNSLYNIGIGNLAGNIITGGLTGDDNIFIGNSAGASTGGINNSIAIGEGSLITASNQFIIGGSGSGQQITDIYLGSGVTAATPFGVTINATGGEGTNISGASLGLSGGKGTGSASGGSILFKTSDAVGTGTTLQSLTDKMIIAASGNVGIGTTAPESKLSVAGGATIGAGYTGIGISAPLNGLIVQGNTGIGSTNPGALFAVGATNQFLINSSGNITRLNGVTTSFPSSQGAANSVLRNDGAGTLTWVDPALASGAIGYWQKVSTTVSPTTISDNVGIGATNVTSKLVVAGGVSIGSGYQGIGISAPLNGMLVQGNVGIGSTATRFALDVNGHIGPNVNDTYDLGSDSFRFQDLYLGPNTLHIGTSTSDEYTISYNTASNFLGFNVNGSGNPEFVYSSGGNFGVGTTAPDDTLDVVGTFQATGTGIFGGELTASSGINIGTNTDANKISTGSLGASSTQLFIGNESILASGDIGVTVQAFDTELTAIAALAVTDGNFIVGNGTTWVAESGATARTSLGLGTIATQNSNAVSITGGSITGITDLAVADGGTGASTAAAARTNLELTSGATGDIWVDEAGDTMTGDLTIGGGNLSFNNATSNIVDWSTAGVAVPTFTTRSAGTKLVLYPAISASAVDYAFGISSSTLWASVPNSSSTFRWYAATTEVASLTGAGALSVDSTVSGTRFLSGAGTQALPAVTFTGDPDTGISNAAGNYMAFSVGGGNAMQIDSNGALTIGGTYGSPTLDAMRLHAVYSNTTDGTWETALFESNNTVSDAAANTNIGAIGDVSNTGSDAAGSKMYGLRGIASNLQTNVTAGASHESYGVYGQATGNTNGSSTAYGIYCQSTGADSNICGGNQTWTQVSDARVKTNISTIKGSDALNIIKALRGVRYNRTDDGSERLHVGFIAQEVLPHLPEVVSYSSGEDKYSMAYAEVTPILVNAMQEQQIQLDTIINSTSSGRDAVFALKLEALEATQVQQQASINGILQQLIRLDVLENSLALLNTKVDMILERLNLWDEAMEFARTTGNSIASLIIKVPTTFSEMAFFKGPIKVSADTSETVEIPAGTLKAKITFNKSFPQKPSIYLNFVDTIPVAHKVIDITEDGFTISFDEAPEESIKIQWLAILRDVDGDAPSVEVIESEGEEEEEAVISGDEEEIVEEGTIEEATGAAEEESYGFAEASEEITLEETFIETSEESESSGIMSTSSAEESNGIVIGGVSIIQAGETSMEVETAELSENSVISVNSDAGVMLSTERVADNKFAIHLDQPYLHDVTVNWEINSAE